MVNVKSRGFMPKENKNDTKEKGKDKEMETIRKSVTVTKELNRLIEIGAAMNSMSGQQYIVLLLELGIPQQVRDLVELVEDENVANTDK